MNGCLLMKAFLSGLPTCSLGLNMRGEDCTFNSVVNQREWDTAKSISFVPPDNGNRTEFEVMRYRIGEHVTPPFKVAANVTEGGRTKAAVRPDHISLRPRLARSLDSQARA